MTRLVVSNQRGGVAKTTTVHTLGRYFADQGQKVLIIDMDPQGSVGAVLGLKPKNYLHHLIVRNCRFEDCVVEACPNLHVLCSNRETAQTEQFLAAAGEWGTAFERVLTGWDQNYDLVVIDVAPSISRLQMCALVYARRMLIPVAMDPLSLQGLGANFESLRLMNAALHMDTHVIAILPVMLDRRLQMTSLIMESLAELAERFQTPVLHPIRVDSTVTKACRERQFLADYDPRCHALEDYRVAAGELAGLFQYQMDAMHFAASA